LANAASSPANQSAATATDGRPRETEGLHRTNDTLGICRGPGLILGKPRRQIVRGHRHPDRTVWPHPLWLGSEHSWRLFRCAARKIDGLRLSRKPPSRNQREYCRAKLVDLH
jgi:hypothetical protein